MTADDVRARPMETAPRDGTMLRLLVRFTEHATDDAEEAWTIGSNSFDANGEDRWQFAGWCWDHDHFTEGKGTPIGWLPMHEPHVDLAGEVRDGTGRSAKDYAIEHAGYMACAATGLIDAVNALELVRQQYEEGDVDEDAINPAEQSLGDALSALRSCIYEFEKRRDRALAKFTQEKP